MRDNSDHHSSPRRKRMPTLSLKRGSLARRPISQRSRTPSRNDDIYLFSSPENARRLMEAYENALAGRGRVMTLDELRAEVGLERP
jgi:hypothetical protein